MSETPLDIPEFLRAGQRTDTPRTDAVYYGPTQGSKHRLLELARQLERECEALRADKARLDFLEKHADAARNWGSGAADDKWWEVLYQDGNETEGGSLREAIDKAIGETKG
jgi:hypothetical protein